MARQDIIQELNELGSSLKNAASVEIYSVPDGYFQNFASAVLARIAEEKSDPEIKFLTRENPYKVPADYFENFEEKMLAIVRNHPDYLNSREELELLSPLLSNLKKEPVYSVPQDYFTNFHVALKSEQPAKVVTMSNRKLFRAAAAAVITAIIAIGGLMIYNTGQKIPGDKVIANVEKDVKKINDVKQLDNLSEMMDAGLNEKSVASVGKIKTDDVEKLLQDVSMEELKDFSEESKEIQDVMVTN